MDGRGNPGGISYVAGSNYNLLLTSSRPWIGSRARPVYLDGLAAGDCARRGTGSVTAVVYRNYGEIERRRSTGGATS